MNNEEIIKELTTKNSTDLNTIVELVCNTVKAKAYYQRGGWSLVDKELGNKYLNPNFSVTDNGLYQKLSELGLKTSINITESMREIQDLVNTAFNYKIVEYRVDRKSHYFHITR